MAAVISSSASYMTVEVGKYNTSSFVFAVSSETATIDIVQKCARNTIFLTWLNSLACWEYWAFQGQSDSGFSIVSGETAKKNLYQNWDTEFVNSETEEFYRFVEAYEQRLVRSQRLTTAQAYAIARIKYSIQVQEIKTDGSKITVLVDKQGGFFKKDREKGTEISFTIKGTSQIAIQKQ